MLRLSDLRILESKDALKDIPQGKKLINTINAHSFNTAQQDELFAEALKNGLSASHSRRNVLLAGTYSSSR